MTDQDQLVSEMVKRLRKANASFDLFDRNAVADELERLTAAVDNAGPLLREALTLYDEVFELRAGYEALRDLAIKFDKRWALKP